MRATAGWFLAFAGSVVVVMAASNYDLTAHSTPEPQEMTLRELLDGKAGANRHVAVTDFRPCDRYLTRNFKREQRRWVSCIGVVPAGADPGGPPRLVVEPHHANEEKHLLENWGHLRALHGVLEKPDRQPESEQRKLRDTYPGIDLSSCLILDEGRVVMTLVSVWQWGLGGGAAVTLGLALLNAGPAVRLWRRLRGAKAAR